MLIIKSVLMLSMYAAPFVSNLKDFAVHKLKEEFGQDVIEYAALAGLIGIGLAAALLFTPLDEAMANFSGALYDCISLDGTCGNGFGGGE